jgi:anti-sigma regulatory factor (Ser/Thr protein kinase)
VRQAVLSARLDLPAGPGAVTTARTAARLLLDGWGVADTRLLDRVDLVVTEIVGNSVRHAGGPGILELSLNDESVTVAAVDSSAEQPVPKTAEGDTGGRGLLIIGAMSTTWGTHQVSGGKRVWARLDLDDHHAGDH